MPSTYTDHTVIIPQSGHNLPKNVKIGHGGTLDPLASGLLPIGLGKATKRLQGLLEGPKTYDFTITFGTATTSDDAEGDVIATSEVLPQPTVMQQLIPAFTGLIQQLPPAFSALKINGMRAYALARSGQNVVLAPRPVTIHTLALIGTTDTTATFRASVSKGTYIRSLARDIATTAGTVGHVTMLRRIAHGPFTLQHSIPLQTLDLSLQSGHITAHLLPLDACLVEEQTTQAYEKCE